VVSLASGNWQDEVANASMPVLVDFGAAWCPPCRMLAPIIAELAAEYQGVMKVGAVDTDAEIDLAAQYDVVSLPTVLLFKGGQVVDRVVGFTPKAALKKRLDELLG
jgi:thioredoxin 1